MFAKTTKALVTALVLAGASLTLIGNASAGPNHGGWSQNQDSYMRDRHNPADTNGF